jgi:hypothetical protein
MEVTARPRGEPRDRTKVLLVLAVVLLAVAVVVLAVVLALHERHDDGPAPRAQPASTATAATTSNPATTSSVGTTASPSTTLHLSAEEAAGVVWPAPGSGVVYDDPVEAAVGMGTRLARFTTPVVGPFQQGDARSGEVELRPSRNGPVTTVHVRKLNDGNWYVLGASTDALRLDSPAAGGAAGSPVTVSGRSTSFEGLVLVTVLAQGDPAPLGQLPMLGGANGAFAPFTGQVHFDSAHVDRPGAIMLSTDSAEDGRVWQVTVVPVMLAGGD